jgi:hypothetical protein
MSLQVDFRFGVFKAWGLERLMCVNLNPTASLVGYSSTVSVCHVALSQAKKPGHYRILRPMTIHVTNYKIFLLFDCSK